MSDLKIFLSFLASYTWSRIVERGQIFGSAKSFFVSLLLAQRGKYSSYLTNASFLFLFFLIFVSAPIIAENHPLSQSAIAEQNSENYLTDTVVALDEGDVSVDTFKNEGVRDKVQIYEVVAGDTMKSLAEKFKVKEQSIAWLNKISTTQTLKKGAKIKIPPIDGVVHVVTPGDNIYLLAKKYQVNAQNIVDFPFNEFRDDSFTLIAGTDLMIPNGKIVELAPVFTDTYNFAQVAAGVQGSSSFIWPTNGIITQYPSSYHMAFDIANPSQPPVIASDAGTVIYSGCFTWGYGCHVIIDHNNGFRTLYGHLSRRDIEQGSTVSQGQQIGLMGSTGRSTGTHLHFELRQGSTLLNPQNYLK